MPIHRYTYILTNSGDISICYFRKEWVNLYTYEMPLTAVAVVVLGILRIT